MKKIWDRKNLPAKILLAAFLTEILGFFIVPIAELTSSGSSLAGLGALAGIHMPKYLTMFGLMRLLSQEEAGLSLLVFALLLLHLLGAAGQFWEKRERLCFGLCGIFYIIPVVPWTMWLVDLADWEIPGYMSCASAGFFLISALIVSVLSWICFFNRGRNKKNALGRLAVGHPAASRRLAAATPSVQNREEQGRITGVAGMFRLAQIPIRNGEQVVIGRSSEMCSIVLTGATVSRRHCSVSYDAAHDKYVITDYSENGTFLKNGQRLPKGRPVELKKGNIIRIGQEEELFQLG